MKLHEIREVARARGLKPGRASKIELVRMIQSHEGNSGCFCLGQAATCGQDGCLWRSDCV